MNDPLLRPSVALFHDSYQWAQECSAESRRLVARYTALHSRIAIEGMSAAVLAEQQSCELSHRFLGLMRAQREVVTPDG